MDTNPKNQFPIIKMSFLILFIAKVIRNTLRDLSHIESSIAKVNEAAIEECSQRLHNAELFERKKVSTQGQILKLAETQRRLKQSGVGLESPEIHTKKDPSSVIKMMKTVSPTEAVNIAGKLVENTFSVMHNESTASVVQDLSSTNSLHDKVEALKHQSRQVLNNDFIEP